ncbi:LADA_0E14576g1_1 [Lachancea dasiensis]|uniref:LADA_0E14576g1_1 n=1 Tax=Lachancea dasiensis TaxID=1072105 RepID=A0A1G4JG94_9SACH|nr:LADA_0E14576g1_1 [Lachancea dasiensis]
MTSLSRRIHRKTGCVPCKIRKKRCSEHKPVCTDCERLDISCVYLPASCSREKANIYRDSVQKQLLERKSRKPSGTLPGPPLLDSSSSIDEIEAEVGDDDFARSNVLAELSPQGVISKIDSDMNGLDFVPIEERYNWEFLENSPYVPTPLPPPSEPLLMQLDDTALHLYRYYRDSLSHIVSIAPDRQNYFLQIFLPMAHQDEGILYGILAWAAHHLSLGEPNKNHGSMIKEKSPAALDETFRDFPKSDDNQDRQFFNLPPSDYPNSQAIRPHVSTTSISSNELSTRSARDSRYAALANEYTLYSLQRVADPKTHGLLAALANILILCGAEICQGDISRWQILLRWGARMIRDYAPNCDIGELLAESERPNSSTDAKTTRWLLSNFAYHDIMGSDPTHFPMQQYRQILDHPDSTHEYHIDPLYGINRPIFQLLGQVKNLARKVKEELTSAGLMEDLVSHKPLYDMIAAAQELQVCLYKIQPSEEDLSWYQSVADTYKSTRSLAQTLFSVFRDTALLHLKTAILRQDISSYEIQFLVAQLSNGLDQILGSPIEAGSCFPLFICGVNSYNLAQRRNLESKFEGFLQRYKFRNVERALIVLRQVWDRSDRGLAQDWFDVVDEIGWNLNFA